MVYSLRLYAKPVRPGNRIRSMLCAEVLTLVGGGALFHALGGPTLFFLIRSRKHCGSGTLPATMFLIFMFSLSSPPSSKSFIICQVITRILIFIIRKYVVGVSVRIINNTIIIICTFVEDLRIQKASNFITVVRVLRIYRSDCTGFIIL